MVPNVATQNPPEDPPDFDQKNATFFTCRLPKMVILG